MILIVLIIIGILLLPMVITTLVLMNDFKYYKKVFKTLPSKTFYVNHSQVYDHFFNDRLKNKEYKFIWFLEYNSFCLTDGHYLSNDWVTRMSPYSWYWLRKYQKWFKENVDVNKLEKY